MDELVHHCLRELAFDGDLGALFYVFLAGLRFEPAWARLADSRLFLS
jgi:hypothetical protein